MRSAGASDETTPYKQPCDFKIVNKCRAVPGLNRCILLALVNLFRTAAAGSVEPLANIEVRRRSDEIRPRNSTDRFETGSDDGTTRAHLDNCAWASVRIETFEENRKDNGLPERFRILLASAATIFRLKFFSLANMIGRRQASVFSQSIVSIFRPACCKRVVAPSQLIKVIPEQGKT